MILLFLNAEQNILSLYNHNKPLIYKEDQSKKSLNFGLDIY